MIDLNKLYDNTDDLNEILNLAFPHRQYELDNYKIVDVNVYKMRLNNVEPTKEKQLHIDLFDDYGLFLCICEDGYVSKQNWSGVVSRYQNPMEISKLLNKYSK